MATLALGVAGAAIGASFGAEAIIFGITAAQIGGFIGSAIGSYIDSLIFAPDLPNTTGSRLTDLKVQVSTYGHPVNRCWGRVRIAGNVIDGSDLRETPHTQEVGGKGFGGGGGSSTTFTYDVDLDVGICVGPILTIERIWADTKLFRFDSFVQYSITANDVTVDGADDSFQSAGLVDVTQFQIGDFIETSGFVNSVNNGTFTVTDIAGGINFENSGTVNVVGEESRINTNESTDFSTLTPGDQIVVSGFVNENNNGTFTFASGGVGFIIFAEGTFATETTNNPVKIIGGADKIITNGSLTSESAGAVVTITRVNPNPASFTFVNASDVRIYLGTETQLVDSLFEGNHGGPGTTPAYRRTAHIVIEKLQLADYANRIPNLSFEVITAATVTVGDVVTDIMLEAGYDASEFDVTELDMALDGYILNEQTSARDAIAPLMVVYNFDAYEDDGVVVFRRRRTEVAGIVTLVENDLSVHAYGEARPEPLEIIRAQHDDIPQMFSLSYIDKNRDYQTNTVRSRRITPFTKGEASISYSMVLDSDKAQNVVEIMHYRITADQIGYKFNSDWRKINIHPGDNILVQYQNRNHYMRIERKVVRLPGMIDFEGKKEDLTVYTHDASNPGAPITTTPQPVATSAQFFGLDTPIASEADDDAGFYWAVDWNGTASGVTLYRSIDGGSTYNELSSTSSEINYGAAAGILPNWINHPARDGVSKVRVVMAQGTLNSISENEFLYGANNGLIWGREIVQFKVAELISPGVYDISILKRGLFGTEWAMNTHQSGEKIFLIDISRIRRISDPSGMLNTQNLYKAVPIGKSVMDVPAYAFTNTGIGKKPYAVTDMRGVRHLPSTNDWTLTWERRTRIPSQILGPIPLAEDIEQYTIEIMNGANVVRTTIVTSPSFIYTSAMQVTDFGSNQSTVTFKVYQMSNVVGRGYVAQKTV